MAQQHQLVILYGIGGLSDVGRHAVQVAVSMKAQKQIESITVLTPYPKLLDEPNWNSWCPPEGQKLFSEEEKKLFTLIQVTDWNDKALVSRFENATAIISCLGNRQPTFMGVSSSSWCSEQGNRMVIDAMLKYGVKRVVVISSTGIEEDWPPMEFHWAGKALSLMFLCCARKPFRDLTAMERAYRKTTDLDFLFVRPVGIGEETVPRNQWRLQKEKYKDVNDLDVEIAKLDVARYMMQEALEPTRHRDAVVIGGVKQTDEKPA